MATAMRTEGRRVDGQPLPGDADALIKEARRLRRRRRLASACGAATALGLALLGVALTSSGSPRHVLPPRLPHRPVLPVTHATPAELSLVRLGDVASHGTFEATYVVHGDLVPYGGRQWLITVAHEGRGAGGRVPGEWSYLLRSSTAGTVQWIERGMRYLDCYRSDVMVAGSQDVSSTWTCGTGINQGSIGFSYLDLPFVPTQFMNDLRNVVDEQGWRWIEGAYNSVTVFARHTAAYGSEQCVRSTVRRAHYGIGFGPVEEVATWCLGPGGIPVSFHRSGRPASTLWSDVRLLSTRSTPSALLLNPIAAGRPNVPLPAM